MCNACFFFCCAMDCFEACGCDHCPYLACWDLEEEDAFDYEDYEEEPLEWTTGT